MFLKIIHHLWLGFRRSDFFTKSMAVKILTAFLILTFAFYINLLGRILPGLLYENFPDKSPGAWVYSYLFAIMLGDLFIRFMGQKLPMRYFTPYMHLPISRALPATTWLIRTLVNPFNFYLLVFFQPFIKLTINPETSSQASGLLGIFLLSLLNHFVFLTLKTLKPGNRPGVIISAVAGVFLAMFYYFFPDRIMSFSLNLFMSFVNKDWWVFLAIILLLFVLTGIVMSNLRQSIYRIYDSDSGSHRSVGNGIIERWLSSYSRLGQYWLLEWRLVLRNKRSKVNFISFPLISILAILIIAFVGKTDDYSTYSVVLFMIAGGYGTFHLQHALSWESRFFDFLSSRGFSISELLLSKYYFYFFSGSVQFIVVIPVLLFFDRQLLILYSGMFLYVMGFGFYVFMRMGINHSSRFDPNGRASFNMEGLSGMRFLLGLGLYLSVIPFFLMNALFPYDHSGTLMMGVTGLIFIATHFIWIKKLAKKFENQKYRNLAIYRQK
jgi:hypothetical protein